MSTADRPRTWGTACSSARRAACLSAQRGASRQHGGRQGRITCMAELKNRLRADLFASMKARDEVRTRTLRMALTSVTNEEVAGATARELTDDEVIAVLAKEARKRRDAAEAFEAAGRESSAAAERAEGEVL